MRFFGHLLLCALLSGNAVAADAEYDDYQGLAAGLFIPDSGRDSGTGFTLDAYFGRPYGATHALEVEAFGAGSSRDAGGSDSFFGLDLGLNWGRREAGYPFLRGSVGGVQESTAAGSGISPLIGLGIGYYPRYDDPRDLLRLELRWNAVFSDAVADKSMLGDVRLLVGLMVGGSPTARMHPDPLVATPPAPDADNDGVRDAWDKCPDTPRFLRPDANGCPLMQAKTETDGDHDGVVDSADQCPDTSSIHTVNETGCATVDSVALSSVYFDLDASALDDEDRNTLEALAGVLKENPGVVLEVAGYADPTGPAGYNQRLSMRRAEAAREFLSGLGVNPAQLQVAGYGIAAPPAVFPDNRKSMTDDERSRRVDFRVLEQ